MWCVEHPLYLVIVIVNLLYRLHEFRDDLPLIKELSCHTRRVLFQRLKQILYHINPSGRHLSNKFNNNFLHIRSIYSEIFEAILF